MGIVESFDFAIESVDLGAVLSIGGVVAVVEVVVVESVLDVVPAGIGGVGAGACVTTGAGVTTVVLGGTTTGSGLLQAARATAAEISTAYEIFIFWPLGGWEGVRKIYDVSSLACLVRQRHRTRAQHRVGHVRTAVNRLARPPVKLRRAASPPLRFAGPNTLKCI